jgi:hypothetical protein
MGFFDFGIKPPTKKQRKRRVLEENKRRGRAAEVQVEMRYRMNGYEMERTGRGHDFKATKRDIITGRVTHREHVEVKSSSTAPVSPLQKETKKKKGSRYRVVRENPFFF